MSHIRPFKIMIITILICLFSASCSMGSGSGGGGNGGSAETNSGHNAALEDLGIDTDLGPRLDPNNNPLPDNYNPLGGKQTTLFKKCEIFVTGMGINGKRHGLFQDGSESSTYALLAQSAGDESGWTTSPKKSVAADTDGDGLDEIINFVANRSANTIDIRVMDYNGAGFSGATVARSISIPALTEEIKGTADTVQSSDGADNWENAFARFDTAVGDLDGDDRPEFVLIVGREVWILDGADGDFATLHSLTMPDISASTKSYVRGACADFDLDGRDELILTNGEGDTNHQATYTVYDDLTEDGDLSTPLVSGDINDGTYSVCAADVATGDFDGDGLPEAAFAGRGHSYPDYHIVSVLDTAMNVSSEPVFSMHPKSYTDEYDDGYRYVVSGVVTGDINGNGLDDIASYQDIYAFSGGELSMSVWGDDALQKGANYESDNYPYLDMMVCGDVTGDGRADVLYHTWDEDQVYIFSSNGSNSVSLYTDFMVGSGANDSFSLCLPNVDNDSPVLVYQEHELLITDPVIIAVLASPPYVAGVNDGGSGGTTFGTSQSQSATSGSSHGFSVGYTLGLKWEAPFGVAEAKVQTTVENSFNWGTSTTHTVTESWGYSTGLGEDKVVFTAIPFDVYYYEVLVSPQSEEVGETVTINIPRNPGNYHQETSFFNSHSDGIKIDDGILGHTLGNPSTYPDTDERNTLQTASGNRGLFSTTPMNVGRTSSGSSSISLEDVTSNTAEYNYTLNVTVESEAEAGVFVAGTSAGYQYGYSYSTTVSSGTYIEGEVPDIPADDSFNDMTFSWGLMAYPLVVQEQQFTVVNYWVQD